MYSLLFTRDAKKKIAKTCQYFEFGMNNVQCRLFDDELLIGPDVQILISKSQNV